MSTPSGLLFDLDGTMLDTDPLHIAAFNQLLAEYGKSVSEAYYLKEIMGAAMDTIMAGLFPDWPEDERMRLGERKEACFREQLKGPLEGRPGLHALLDWAKANDVGICVVTNAPRDNAELMLDSLGVRHQIDHLLIGAELSKSKPDPYPYQEGMRLLGVDTAHAVAFEDSGPGVRSAASAGLYTFGMLGAFDDVALHQHGASAALEDFTARALSDKLREIAPHARALLA